MTNEQQARYDVTELTTANNFHYEVIEIDDKNSAYKFEIRRYELDNLTAPATIQRLKKFDSVIAKINAVGLDIQNVY